MSASTYIARRWLRRLPDGAAVGTTMTVDDARAWYGSVSRLLSRARCWHPGLRVTQFGACLTCSADWLLHDAASLALDNATALAVAGPRPAWSQRREIAWEDRLCKTLLESVAW